MSALEREILEKLHLLDTSSKVRVLENLNHDLQSTFDYGAWWANVEALQSQISNRLGSDATIGALSLLDELREEAS